MLADRHDGEAHQRPQKAQHDHGTRCILLGAVCTTSAKNSQGVQRYLVFVVDAAFTAGGKDDAGLRHKELGKHGEHGRDALLALGEARAGQPCAEGHAKAQQPQRLWWLCVLVARHHIDAPRR